MLSNPLVVLWFLLLSMSQLSLHWSCCNRSHWSSHSTTIESSICSPLASSCKLNRVNFKISNYFWLVKIIILPVSDPVVAATATELSQYQRDEENAQHEYRCAGSHVFPKNGTWNFALGHQLFGLLRLVLGLLGSRGWNVRELVRRHLDFAIRAWRPLLLLSRCQ